MTIRQVTPADGSAQLIINWDGGGTVLTAGQVLDVQPGSALENVIGLANLTSLSGELLADDQQADTETDNG
jgi:hypothetical protein